MGGVSAAGGAQRGLQGNNQPRMDANVEDQRGASRVARGDDRLGLKGGLDVGEQRGEML